MNKWTLKTVALVSTFWSIPVLGQWSLPVQITNGPNDDRHPSFANAAFGNLYNGEEWIAFSRASSIGSNICLMKTRDQGLHWVDTVYSMTDDSTGNDFPTLARAATWSGENRMMLLWQRGGSPSRIWYTFNGGNGWSAPSPLTGDSSSERSPYVVPRDSGFGAVWEHGGRIAFAEFLNDVWTSPVFVTPPEDSGNCLPELSYINFRPWVIWEKAKPGESAHSIMHSLRSDTTWSTPDSVAHAGDNRNPRFSKPAWMNGPSWISYESNLTGDWEIYGNGADANAGSIEWFGQAENLSQNPLADDRHASFMSIPLIIAAHAGQNPFYSLAGTWTVESGGSDSILVTRGPLYRSYMTVAPGTTDRNPDISSGVMSSSVLRVWSVWENDATGAWKLYGSCADIVVDVGQEESFAGSFRLDQNYPNPFNPTTGIRYQVPGVSDVRLAVYDLLGREVAVLVNERKTPGSYEVRFDAAGLASGVYFYRLSTNNFVQTRKLVLLR